MSNEVTNVVEATVEPVAEVVETVKKVPSKGKTGLIIVGVATGVIGLGLVGKYVIAPRLKKNKSCKNKDEAPIEATTEVTEEVTEAPEKDKKSKK